MLFRSGLGKKLKGFLAGDMLLTEVLGGQGKGTVKKVRVAEDGQEAGHSL